MCGHSLRSLRSSAAEEDEIQSAEQEYWFSSKGLLSVLLHWCRFRKTSDGKSQAKCAFLMLLEKCVHVDKLLALRPREMQEENLRLCALDPDERHVCKCVARAQAQAARVQGSLHRVVTELAVALFREDKCGAALACLANLLSGLAGVIDEDPEEWGNPNLLEVRDLDLKGPSGKRRRLDPHVAELACTADHFQAGTPSSTSKPAYISIQQMRSVITRSCCEHQAASRLTCSTSVIVSGAFDAVRLGKPALDLLLHQIWDHRSSSSAMLPNAASLLVCVSSLWSSRTCCKISDITDNHLIILVITGVFGVGPENSRYPPWQSQSLRAL